jgi:hypothetical protein
MNEAPKTSNILRIFVAYRWLTVVTTLGILIQAVLASQGVWGGESDFISGHAQLGNALFLLVVVQAFLSFQISSAGLIQRGILWLNLAMVVLIVAQIGLGYSTRDNLDATAWHVPNGVLLMGVGAILASTAWFRPQAATN